MRHRKTIRGRAIPGLLSLALTLTAAPPAAMAGNGPPTPGGSGVVRVTPNPFVGSWVGEEITEEGGFSYHFTFTKGFTFTLAETQGDSGMMTAAFVGTYSYGGLGPNGFPVLTLWSQGQVLMQFEVRAAFGGIILDSATHSIHLVRAG